MTLDDVDLSFACSCSDKSKEEIALVRKWVEEYLKTTNPEEIIDDIVFRLDHYYYAAIQGIYTDQWSVVMANTHPAYNINSDKHNPKFASINGIHTYIQCDSVFDGFLYTLRTFYKTYGDKITLKSEQ